ncbi:hypothetical protein B0H17DRAFT_1270748 [Mycena rosella]|uniref:Uncharacterized protein n=1 Tax=Mycena rosella TaxID=1033263 RepID=A0AAD7CJS1_MYCRO|nr:hypothetical protein B0H17DRAFT_1270748 [Mycena rosella]
MIEETQRPFPPKRPGQVRVPLRAAHERAQKQHRARDKVEREEHAPRRRVPPAPPPRARGKKGERRAEQRHRDPGIRRVAHDGVGACRDERVVRAERHRERERRPSAWKQRSRSHAPATTRAVPARKAAAGKERFSFGGAERHMYGLQDVRWSGDVPLSVHNAAHSNPVGEHRTPDERLVPADHLVRLDLLFWRGRECGGDE